MGSQVSPRIPRASTQPPYIRPHAAAETPRVSPPSVPPPRATSPRKNDSKAAGGYATGRACKNWDEYLRVRVRRVTLRPAVAATAARTAPPVGEFTATAVAVAVAASMMAAVAMGVTVVPAVMAVAVVALRLTAMAVRALPFRRAERVLGDGDLLPRHLFDVAQEPLLGVIAERDGDAVGAGARGAADAMDVAFGHVRQL